MKKLLLLLIMCWGSIEAKDPFFVVDAFASKPFRGNPAGVMIVGDFPCDKRCVEIAGEMNFSATAFVRPIKGNRFEIRWFTPAGELSLCGHGTLGAAHVLFREGLVSPLDRVVFESAGGPLYVERNGGRVVLDFPLQETVVCAFSLPGDLPIVNTAWAQDDLIFELESEQAVRTLEVDSETLSTIECRGIIFTAKGEGKYDFVSRFFAPRLGIAEDPVTGSAHCRLAHYWQRRLGKDTFLAYQASERGGELGLTIEGDRVKISGQAILMLRGKFMKY